MDMTTTSCLNCQHARDGPAQWDEGNESAVTEDHPSSGTGGAAEGVRERAWPDPSPITL